MGEAMNKKKKRGCLMRFLSGILTVLCLILAVLCIRTAGSEGISWIREQLFGSEIVYQEVRVGQEELEGKYYYQQIAEEERQAYQEILQGVRDHIDAICIHASKADRANALFQYVMKDFPEIFWCDGTTTATAYDGNEMYTILEPGYLYDEQKKSEMEQEIQMAADQCLSGVPEGADDYQKILYVYEYIVNLVDYDMNASDNQNIYSVFVNHRSVCAGYSKATQYLLERMGVFCTYVTGTTKEGQTHAWNLVLCNGDYYYVDTTWGDPVFQESEGEDTAAWQGNVSYDYMCCDDTQISGTHIPDTDAALPACTKMDYNYYVVNGLYYTEYNRDAVLEKMNETIRAGANPTVIKFADHDLYASAYDDIFQNLIKSAAQNLASYYGLSEVRYQYMDDPDLNKIMIIWQYQ